jgi:predicted RND superfamily exporter protein
VAQSILSFQSSHDPDDVYHLVTSDFRRLNIWVQLKSGDNRDMESVVASVDSYFEENPLPEGLSHSWAGLTYINIVWQDEMVSGMLDSLKGSFWIVLILMSILFRSLFWGMISMVPLSVTIAFIYGVIGLVGKDYDMPVAVLSSLTLGMSIDFAIHYIQRARELVNETGSWSEAALEMAEAPGRAITRNAVVIAVGFAPLLFAGLVPYRTVGVLLAAIMAVSGIGTLIILPSLIEVGQSFLFKGIKPVEKKTAKKATTPESGETAAGEAAAGPEAEATEAAPAQPGEAAPGGEAPEGGADDDDNGEDGFVIEVDTDY